MDVKGMPDKELKSFMSKNAISLKISEAKKVAELLGRNPTLVELHIFNTEWSEHCSYKSSKPILKLLPTKGPTVIQGPQEDAGIIHLANVGKDRYGIVIAHESHNHPSQVVPYEGAATGIGGIVRDVLCMGARIIATADPLRFGNPNGKFKDRTRYIANAVIDGISGYTNPIGIPNIAGDVYFNDSFDDNCLVNVVSLGLVKEKEIIHSAAPENAEGHDIIIVGKATDNSGFGGAAFASLILDEKEEEFNKGAVQVPDPFLKNVLIRATEAVFKEVREKGIKIGFKDMGAGGIMCSSSELCDSAGFGAEIDLDKVHVSMNIPPYIIACSETQERFTWICPPDFTERLLEIYNKDFELPNIAEGAQATVIGKVTKKKDYIMRYEGKIVCNAPVNVVTSGILYDREQKKPKKDFKEPDLKEPSDYNKALINVLSHPNVASKAVVYKHYDTEVQGLAVIRPGEADAGVQAPIPGKKIGYALSVDSNPLYARIDSYAGGAAAVAEAMRNVAAVGAVPYGMTDCLNFGNPEKPEAFYEFVEGVKGIADAAKNLYVKGTKDPVPFVSGNVSFYNESVAGKAVDPSAVIACVGVLDDYTKAITMKLKKAGSSLFMVGARKDELGGSVYYQINKEVGANIPKIDFEQERNAIYGVIDCIDSGLLLSCHDISDGGVAVTVSEMILGGEADGQIGAEVNIDSDLRNDKVLFSESSGFVFEVDEQNINKIESIFKKYNQKIIKIGKTTDENSLKISKNNEKLVDLKIDEIKTAWTSGFVEAMK
ncbi:phosphoribosylformylglycinamidine synthase subunit PurL [Candidatus Woesearchaeota archaeon]|nr:phosphoribosylformylglycinamidine synthase subunit PurL [Candidatus Woesearchaeota archaeon]